VGSFHTYVGIAKETGASVAPKRYVAGFIGLEVAERASGKHLTAEQIRVDCDAGDLKTVKPHGAIKE
jgi:hypothetical protein